MPGRAIILSVLGAALVFGLVASGCNRNRDTRVAMNSRRQPKRAESHHQESANVRPAEVLAVSVKRRPQRRSPAPIREQYHYPQQTWDSSSQLAQAYEPLPEPIPVSALYPTYAEPAPQYSQSSQPFQPLSPPDALSQPTYAYMPPPIVPQASPELTMAKAMLQPIEPVQPVYVPQVQPINFVPPIEPKLFHAAPIPELEPVRYNNRVATTPAPIRVPRPVPAIPVLMSGGRTAPAPTPAPIRHQSNQAMQRALAPLPQAAPPSNVWVSSPATAMANF